MNKNERKYCVYKHTSPSNKVYIGITYNTKKRWCDGNGYLHKRKDGKYNQPLFARAILKYGWENFTHEILINNLSKEQACELEKKYIKEYDSTNLQKGYNISFGGDAVMYNKHHSKETKRILRQNGMKKEDYYRSINQYDINGNFIKTWKDSSEIYDSEFKSYCAIIKKCCHRIKNNLSIGGYQWRFTDDCDDISEYTNFYHTDVSNYRHREIYEINPINSEIIKYYHSIKDCNKELGYSDYDRKILDCCRGQTISVEKRLFVYVEDYKDKDKIQERLNKYKNKFKPKLGLVENGQITKTWLNFSECGRELNIDRKIIKKICDGVLDNYEGYTFRYIS